VPQVNELVDRIAELDPIEYESLLHTLVTRHQIRLTLDKLTQPAQHDQFPSIVSTANVCGGAKRFIRTRIPVWTVERMRQLGVNESEILRNFPTLRAADLVQAWAYADQHRDEMEKAIAENETE
jgi:uncharacterized protein (DUF433 family)